MNQGSKAKGKKYVVVVLTEEDEGTERELLCRRIVENADVAFAYPAKDDGFGHLVMDGASIHPQP